MCREILLGSISSSREEQLGFHYWDNRHPCGWVHWAFGWKTGIDNDLICVFPNVKTRVLEHYALSPVCSNRLLALLAFIIKRLLFILDPDLRYRRTEKDGGENNERNC